MACPIAYSAQAVLQLEQGPPDASKRQLRPFLVRCVPDSHPAMRRHQLGAGARRFCLHAYFYDETLLWQRSAAVSQILQP